MIEILVEDIDELSGEVQAMKTLPPTTGRKPVLSPAMTELQPLHLNLDKASVNRNPDAVAVPW